MDARRQKAQELRRQIEWTLGRAIDPADALPMLHRLARLADPSSEEGLFANLQIAEFLLDRHPWRAALFARRVLAYRPDDDRGWATLACSQTLLGNYRCAVSAYHHALEAAIENPSYAHNLGHVLDVALGRPAEAVVWLKRAYESATESGDVAASYAHALARLGRAAEARGVLSRAMKHGGSREHVALLKWIEQGAPPGKDHLLSRLTALRATTRVERQETDGVTDGVPSDCPSPRARGKSGARGQARLTSSAADLEGILARGLSSLPLDAKQRARARALARDAATTSHPSAPSAARLTSARGGPGARPAVDALAAAVAYAIVYVDHVPLTQAEVAACFRVRVASLRARFAELRAHLVLLPGDARYATLRQR